MVQDLGSRVWVQGLGWSLGFRVWDFGFVGLSLGLG
jgi:hypothetical protein